MGCEQALQYDYLTREMESQKPSVENGHELDFDELEYMDEDERREALEDAGYDPDDFADGWQPLLRGSQQQACDIALLGRPGVRPS